MMMMDVREEGGAEDLLRLLAARAGVQARRAAG